jgi:hypothetical protein
MYTKASFTLIALALAGATWAQTVVPDGTLVKLRLNEALNSGLNRVGQGVSLSVVDDVVVNDHVVIEAGSRATGVITVAEAKRRMGRGGKLDFIPEKLQLSDGRMVGLRATQQGFNGKGHGVTTGVVAAGLAIAFWPAAPLALLIKGKDIDIPAGSTFTTFTDAKIVIKDTASQTVSTTVTPATVVAERNTTVTVASDTEGAEIEVDGSFVGQAPASLTLSAGEHHITVRYDSQVWERTLRVTPGNNVNLKAQFATSSTRIAARLPKL